MKRRDFMCVGVAAVALAAVPVGVMAATDWKSELLSKASDLETRRANAAVKAMENFIATNPGEEFNDFNVVDWVDEQAWAVIARTESGKQYVVGFTRVAL